MNANTESKICRICPSRKSNNLISLLDAENKTIVKKLRACADVSIEPDDLLPKYICAICLRELESAYYFKIKCESRDQELRRKISNSLSYCQKLTTKSEGSSLGETTSDLSDSYESDATQSMMYDLHPESGSDEKYRPNNDSTITKFTTYSQNDQNNQDNLADNAHQSKNVQEGDAMEISPKVSIDENNDFGLFSAVPKSNENEYVDQEMFSVKSDQDSLPQRKPTFKCKMCGVTFMAFVEYSKHMKTHESNRYKCSVCCKWFAKRYQLNAHHKTHNKTKSSECLICKQYFPSQSDLDRHIRSFHKKEREHICGTCKKTFTQLASLRLHQSIHGAEREFYCDTCNTKFKSEFDFKVHKKRHLLSQNRTQRKYTPPKKPYKPPAMPCICSECGKQFKNLALLRCHLQSHSQVKKYECSFCKKKFSFQQTLRNHIYEHTGEKRFKCDVCTVSFRQIGHLQVHKLVHSGLKPHSCSVCGKAFTLRGNLTVHVRTHSCAQIYQCELCPEKFGDCKSFKRHQSIHQQEAQINSNVKQILDAPIIYEAATTQINSIHTPTGHGSEYPVPTVSTAISQVSNAPPTYNTYSTFNLMSNELQFTATPNVATEVNFKTN